MTVLSFLKVLPGDPGSAVVADFAAAAMALTGAVVAGAIAALVFLIAFPSDGVLSLMVANVERNGRNSSYRLVDRDGAMIPQVRTDYPSENVSTSGGPATGAKVRWVDASSEDFGASHTGTAYGRLLDVYVYAAFAGVAALVLAGALLAVSGSDLLFRMSSWLPKLLLGPVVGMTVYSTWQLVQAILATVAFGRLRAKLLRQALLDNLRREEGHA